MVNLQREIQDKRREITRHEDDLLSLYGDLGRVAIVEASDEIRGLVEQERLAYQSALALWEEAHHFWQQISGYIRQMEDRTRKISEIEDDISTLAETEREVWSRLGAIAYEAFGFDGLSDRLREVCYPLFSAHHRQVARLEHRIAGHQRGFTRRLTLLRLTKRRRRLAQLLYEAGRLIAQLGWEEDFSVQQTGTLAEEVETLRIRRSDLTEELDLHKSAVAKLRSEEEESPKARLEASRIRMGKAEQERDRASERYGRVLYEEAQDHHLGSLGEKASLLIHQISLHRKRISKLEREIESLDNRIKADELRAQIDRENHRIALLQAQMESCQKQIDLLGSSIHQKESQIRDLLTRSGERGDD